MSEFEVLVGKLHLEVHPNADKLLLGNIEGQAFKFVCGIDFVTEGQIGCYISTDSIIPDPLIEEMEAREYLGGPEKNRVKTIRLRKEISQGLFYTPKAGLPDHWKIGMNVAEELGITKWEPPIPIEMAGQVKRVHDLTPEQIRLKGESIFRAYTDIENWMKYPKLFTEGEEVSLTLKGHGTCFISLLLEDDTFIISSLGIAKQRLVLVESPTNVYWRAAYQYQIKEKLIKYRNDHFLEQVMLFGEILGVQDLKYSLKPGEIRLEAFDLYQRREGGDPYFVDACLFRGICEGLDIPLVTLAYEGPFSHEMTLELAKGQHPGTNHIREGVVVKPMQEAEDSKAGRKVLKYLNPAYLLRDKGTEMH